MCIDAPASPQTGQDVASVTSYYSSIVPPHQSYQIAAQGTGKSPWPAHAFCPLLKNAIRLLKAKPWLSRGVWNRHYTSRKAETISL